MFACLINCFKKLFFIGKNSNSYCNGLYQKMVNIAEAEERYKYCVPFERQTILNFPLQIEKKYTMYEYLDMIFKKYYELLEKVGACEIKKDAKELGDAILESLRVYYNGNTIKAYEMLEKKLSNIFSGLKEIIVENDIKHRQSFYRMRAETNLNSAEDFYHTPFNKRYFCGPQRFSVPGYPTLYVAYSKSCCMVEMKGYHSLGKFKYVGKGKVKILDLTMNPPIGGKKGEQPIHEKIFLKYWPLIEACYVVNTVPENIDKRQAKFREEYIIPQLLSLYVKENLVNKKEDQGEIWGIRYYTVNKEDLNPRGTGENDYRNIMFFTEYDENSQTPYDMELMKKFKFKGSKQV